MRRNKNLNRINVTLIGIVLSMIVLSCPAVPTSRAQTNSVPVSQPSATPASQDDALRAACADAIDELKAARQLLKSQGALIDKQNELLTIEHQLSEGQKNLRTMDAAEKAQLRRAVDSANNETAGVRAENAVLKKNQVTIWKKAKWFVIGGAAGIIAGAVLTNR